MTKPYPMELRERSVRFVKAGESRHAVAVRLGISPSCVIKWLDLYRRTGSVKLGKMGGHVPPKKSGAHRDWVLAQIAAGDVTLQGLADGLAERALNVDYRTVWNFVHRKGKSFKKTVHGTEQTRPDVARRRHWWHNYQGMIDPARLVFIDETWTKTNMAPLRGWSDKGERCATWTLENPYIPCRAAPSRPHRVNDRTNGTLYFGRISTPARDREVRAG
jgi:transposase